MPVFEEFPYTDFHELNLDWLLHEMKRLRHDFAEFVGGHTIKYADPIQWSILTAYPAYTIVLDNLGNAYMTIQDTPAGTPLTDTDYWMQIGNFYGYVDTAIAAAIADLKPQKRIGDFPVYYVDVTGGDDSNDGLTSATPFKTLNRFFELANEQTFLACHITTAGTYNVSVGHRNISDLTLRIVGDAPGINIIWETDGANQVTVNNSFLHFEDLNIDIHKTGPDYSGNLVCNNTFVSFTDVDLSGAKLQIYGSTARVTNCSFREIEGNNSEFRISGVSITNSDPDTEGYHFINSQVEFATASTSSNLVSSGTDPNGKFIYADACHLVVKDQIMSSTMNKYYKVAQMQFCTIIADTTAWASFDSYGSNSSDYSRNFVEQV